MTMARFSFGHAPAVLAVTGRVHPSQYSDVSQNARTGPSRHRRVSVTCLPKDRDSIPWTDRPVAPFAVVLSDQEGVATAATADSATLTMKASPGVDSVVHVYCGDGSN
mmetsp:Transcript_107534/g.213564  ORF Transcript_107534/g.213564 Transcript_107534/m.213564 type:complete len:108 (-) Transcript_107534:115-438(-)